MIHADPKGYSSDFYASLIQEMIEFWDSKEQLTVSHAKADYILHLHGMIAHVLAMGKSSLILRNNDRSFDMQPLVRIALEFALTAQFIHGTEIGLEAYKEKITRRHENLLVRLPSDEQLASFKSYLEELQFEFKGLNFPKIENLMQNIDSSGKTYTIYTILSGFIHPGSTTGNAYIQLDKNNNLKALVSNAPLEIETEVLGLLAIAIVLALGVYEDLRKSKPFKKIVQSYADQVGVARLLKFSTG